MDDEQSRPSLLLARHEKAHREHLYQHQHHHNLIHRDQSEVTETAIQSVVTEITATVSVIQQIDVDSNGSTFSIQTILAPTPAIGTATSDNTPNPTTSASPGPISSSSSSASSTNAQESPQLSSASQSLKSSTSTSSSISSHSSSFSSLIASNSTTLISSSSSSFTITPNFANSSISSTSPSSSFTYLSSSSSSFEEPSTSSTSSLYSPTSSPVTNTFGAGGIGGGTATSTSTPTSTAGAGSGNGTNESTTPTPVVVGGVVGSVAGAAILIFLLLAFIRWKKRHQSMLSLSGNEGPGAVTGRGLPPPDAPSGGMTERRSLAFVPAALANLTGFNNRSSRQTDRTVSSTAGSERGFYRVSGRKLPSVLQSGGDGYGGGIPESNTLSGSSFYRDSQGFYGGPGSPTTAGPSAIRPESGIPVMRPSPARTPITQQGPFSDAPVPLAPPRRPDGLGRSHPSQDGSHTSSRFTEDV